MEFMAEWKSLWPVASTFSAPLFIPNDDPKIPFGPLIFTQSPSFSTTILHAPSLSPHLPPPYPQLTLSRFLQSYSSIPSYTTSISSFLGPQLPNFSSEYHGFNSLQLLQIPNKNQIIVFFPAGENSDRVGFSVLSVKDGILGVHSQRDNFFHVLEEGNENCQRITCLLVNPVDDFCCNEKGDGKFTKNNMVLTAVGFLMVCRKYSVYWYRVGISTTVKPNETTVCLDCVGFANAKMLMGKPVASACWSPHLEGECLVLLESGDLLLFDVNYSSGRKDNSMFLVNGCNSFVYKKARVPLSDKLGLKEGSLSEGRQWFGCDFSWHPRIFIVCHRNEILLVDLRSSGECNVCCLLKLEMLSLGKNDGFFSLSRAGSSDGFHFVVVTRYLLLLSDVRKPLIPVLRWAHTIRNPRYMTVFRLSELRANAKETKYKWASESGYCVMLGSFWDNNFSLFFYGPDDNGDGFARSKISKFCNSYYAWGASSELSLSGSDCKCGSCLVREEFWKSSLPIWTDWRHRKELILGFGILNPDLSAQLSSFGSFGGFTMIRLTSSGKLEAQNYLTAWGSNKFSEGHKRKSIQLEDNLLYNYDYSEYNGVKKFQHLKLEFLNAYLKDELAKPFVKRREKIKESDVIRQVAVDFEGCPMELNFDDNTIDFGPMGLEIFRTLKKNDLEFQRSFKEKAKVQEEYRRNRLEFKQFLESCSFIKVDSQWRKVQDLLEDDERCTRLDKIDRLDIFQDYIRDLEKEEEEQKKRQKEQLRRVERKNHDAFRKMMEEHIATGTLTAKTYWRDYCQKVKDSEAYEAIASNISGSTPNDLFEDVTEELEKKYDEDKTQIKDVLKQEKIAVASTWTFEDFKSSIGDNTVLHSISDINLQLVYEDLIDRAKEKEEKEAKKCKRLAKVCYRHGRKANHWLRKAQSTPYRSIGEEDFCREVFDEYISRLQEKVKEKERKREEEKAKKEKEREDKEKRKDKDRKEKERDKEKEKDRDRDREREKKGKDSSRKDEETENVDAVESHGHKDGKKREKDKDKKHRKRHQSTTDDVSSDKDEKEETKKSRRHGNDRKKSRKHAYSPESDSESRHKRHKRDHRDGSKRTGHEELEDGELGEDGEIQ